MDIAKEKLNKQLGDAVSENDIDTIKKLLASGADVDCTWGGFKWSMLSLAVTGKDASTVKVLLDAGADVNKSDPSGRTPLHYAVLTKSNTIVKQLQDAGANPSAQDKWGDTPLTIALKNGEKNIALALLEHPTNPASTELPAGTPANLLEEIPPSTRPLVFRYGVSCHQDPSKSHVQEVREYPGLN